MRVGSGWLFVLALCAVITSSSRSEAQELARALSIAISDHPPCFKERDLEASVSQHIGDKPVPADLKVDLIPLSESTLVFHLWRHGRVQAVRRFGSIPSDCAEALAAVSVAIAIAIDAEQSAPPQEPKPEPVQPKPPPPPAPSPKPAPTQRYLVSGSGLVSVGVAGAPGLGASVSAALLQHSTLAARISFSGQFGDTSIGAGEASLRLVTVSAYLCATTPTGDFGAAACAGPGFGHFKAEGRGFDRPLSSTALWSAALLRLSGDWQPAKPVLVELAAEGVAPISRPTLVVRTAEGETASEKPTNALGVQFTLGVGARW